MIKVLYVCAHFQPAWDWGGPIATTWNAIKGLSRNEIQVTVVTTNATQNESLEIPSTTIEDNVLIHRLRVRKLKQLKVANRYAISTEWIRYFLRHVDESDVVHVSGLWGMPSFIAMEYCKCNGIPYIISAHGTMEKRSLKEKTQKKQLALALGLKQIIVSANQIVFSSEMERSQMPDWVPTEKTVVIPNIVEIEPIQERTRLRQQWGLKHNQIALGIVGRIHPRKGFDVLIPALSKCINKDKVKLFVIGSDEADYSEEVRKMSRIHGIENNIEFVGGLNQKEIAGVYSGLDLLVMPSHGESFGNVVIESLICGIPCVVNEEVGVAEYIAETEAGIISAAGVEAWKNAIDYSIGNLKELTEKARQAKETTKNRYCTAAVVDCLVELYQKASNTRR